jgi:signal transduction histidine kinase
MRTLRQQFTVRLLLGVAVPLILGGLSVFLLTRAALQEQFDAALHAKAIAITTITRQSAEGLDVDTADPLMHEFEAPHHRSRAEHAHATPPRAPDHELHHPIAPGCFQMWRADGTSLKRSESLAGADLPPNYGTLLRPKFWNLTLPSGLSGRAVGFAFEPPPSSIEPRANEGTNRTQAIRHHPISWFTTDKTLLGPGDIIFVTAVSRQELDETLATLALVLSGCGILLLGITAVVVPQVLRRGFVPLESLAAQAARIDADSLSARFATEALPGELIPISVRLNDLLARLEQSFERERQFSADLAHELRTPIAELRSLAELDLKWPDARSPGTDEETLAIAIQMEGIVSRLLTLLRSERGQLPVTWGSVSFATLVQEAWKPFEPRATAKHLRVDCRLPENREIDTDAVLVRSILSNLMDNAIEYSPPGTVIWIEGEVNADQFTVRVVNQAGNLLTSDLPKLFERFWRKDSARSNAEHSGLGLSLARAFARVLEGDLTAALDDQSILTISLSAPARQPATTAKSGAR